MHCYANIRFHRDSSWIRKKVFFCQKDLSSVLFLWFLNRKRNSSVLVQNAASKKGKDEPTDRRGNCIETRTLFTARSEPKNRGGGKHRIRKPVNVYPERKPRYFVNPEETRQHNRKKEKKKKEQRTITQHCRCNAHTIFYTHAWPAYTCTAGNDTHVIISVHTPTLRASD